MLGFQSFEELAVRNLKDSGYVDFISLHLKSKLNPGEEGNFRYLRGVQAQNENLDSLKNEMALLKQLSLKQFFNDNLKLFSNIPKLQFESDAERLVYLGALNLVRGCMERPAITLIHFRETLSGGGDTVTRCCMNPSA